jgi:GT2 family glycosyltransferase/tetratricopeptide (TPR) repeat protein
MSFSATLLGTRRAAAGLIRRADRARDAGAHAEAAELYSRALDLIPARTDIRVQLGHMLKELGRYQAAEAAYRRALERSPDAGDIHLELGRLLNLTGRDQEAIAAYRSAARLLKGGNAPLAELSALGATEIGPVQQPSGKSCEAYIKDGDRWRDTRDYARAAEAYGAAIALEPARNDIRVQYGNMLKDAGRLQEAEVVYRLALARAPDEAEIHLQLGHTLKLQGRRAAALECYRRAADLAPFMPAPQRELFSAGERATQERLFEAQLRLGGTDGLMEVSQKLVELRAALDRIAETLPDIQAQLAFPITCYDRFREIYDVPDPPTPAASRSFTIILPADRERLETLRAQIAAIQDQTHHDWILRVVSFDPACRRVVEQIAATDSRIAWAEADENRIAEAERRVAVADGTDWILLLGERALLHPKALAWFAAAAERAEASAFVTDEEAALREHGRLHYSSPEFRQVVDYDTLLETNPFGETVAIEYSTYAGLTARLTTPSILAARSSLLLNLARLRKVGHLPLALVARDGESIANPERVATAHEEAVQAYVVAESLGGQLAISRHQARSPRLTVRWRPRVADSPIAVIIPTRDNGQDLRAAIDSLRQTARLPEALRFIVVDNGSRETETCRIIDEVAERSLTRVIEIDEPFNWSRLNNRAVASVDHPLLLFCNDDVVMLSEEWDDVVRGLLDRPEVGALGARLLYPDETIQHAGVLFGWRGGTIHDGLYESRWAPGPGSRWQVTRAVGAVTGAFLATRRELFLAQGGFDETRLAVSYGDIDYALKLRACGLKVLWTPEITASHHESKSRGLDHLDPEKRARDAAERAVMEARWGTVMTSDPSLNPVWHMATLPFRLLSAPSQARLWAHIKRCGAANPWLPDTSPHP